MSPGLSEAPEFDVRRFLGHINFCMSNALIRDPIGEDFENTSIYVGKAHLGISCGFHFSVLEVEPFVQGSRVECCLVLGHHGGVGEQLSSAHRPKIMPFGPSVKVSMGCSPSNSTLVEIAGGATYVGPVEWQVVGRG